MKSIEKDEEVLIDYTNGLGSIEMRERFLRNGFRFRCACEGCCDVDRKFSFVVFSKKNGEERRDEMKCIGNGRLTNCD